MYVLIFKHHEGAFTVSVTTLSIKENKKRIYSDE